MADTWDDFVETERAGLPAPPAEVVLWALHKGTRVAEARVCPHPVGQELRFLYGGDLLWSEG